MVVHTFGSIGEAYSESLISKAVLDGDVLFAPADGVAAVLYDGAYPMAVNEPHGEFHWFIGGPDKLAAARGGRYAESVRKAREVIAARTAPGRGQKDARPQASGGAVPAHHRGGAHGAASGTQ